MSAWTPAAVPMNSVRIYLDPMSVCPVSQDTRLREESAMVSTHTHTHTHTHNNTNTTPTTQKQTHTHRHRDTDTQTDRHTHSHTQTHRHSFLMSIFWVASLSDGGRVL